MKTSLFLLFFIGFFIGILLAQTPPQPINIKFITEPPPDGPSGELNSTKPYNLTLQFICISYPPDICFSYSISFLELNTSDNRQIFFLPTQQPLLFQQQNGIWVYNYTFWIDFFPYKYLQCDIDKPLKLTVNISNGSDNYFFSDTKNVILYEPDRTEIGGRLTPSPSEFKINFSLNISDKDTPSNNLSLKMDMYDDGGILFCNCSVGSSKNFICTTPNGGICPISFSREVDVQSSPVNQIPGYLNVSLNLSFSCVNLPINSINFSAVSSCWQSSPVRFPNLKASCNLFPVTLTEEHIYDQKNNLLDVNYSAFASQGMNNSSITIKAYEDGKLVDSYQWIFNYTSGSLNRYDYPQGNALMESIINPSTIQQSNIQYNHSFTINLTNLCDLLSNPQSVTLSWEGYINTTQPKTHNFNREIETFYCPQESIKEIYIYAKQQKKSNNQPQGKEIALNPFQNNNDQNNDDNEGDQGGGGGGRGGGGWQNTIPAYQLNAKDDKYLVVGGILPIGKITYPLHLIIEAEAFHFKKTKVGEDKFEEGEIDDKSKIFKFYLNPIYLIFENLTLTVKSSDNPPIEAQAVVKLNNLPKPYVNSLKIDDEENKTAGKVLNKDHALSINKENPKISLVFSHPIVSYVNMEFQIRGDYEDFKMQSNSVEFTCKKTCSLNVLVYTPQKLRQSSEYYTFYTAKSLRLIPVKTFCDENDTLIQTYYKAYVPSLMILILTIALAYAAGSVFLNPVLLDWAKREIAELLLLAVLFLVLPQFLLITCSKTLTVSYLTSLFVNSPAVPSSFFSQQPLLDLVQSTMSKIISFTHSNIALLRRDIAYFYIRGSYYKYEPDTVLQVLNSIGGVATKGESSSPHSSDYLFAGLFSFLLNLNNFYLFNLLSHYFLLFFLSSSEGLIVFLLPFGMFLRCLPFFKKLGGVLIAIGIGFYILYPLAFGLYSILLDIDNASSWVGVSFKAMIKDVDVNSIAAFSSKKTEFMSKEMDEFSKDDFQQEDDLSYLNPYFPNSKDSIAGPALINYFKLSAFSFLLAFFFPTLILLFVLAFIRDIASILGEDIDVSRIAYLA